jgi:hypothetical protein
LVIPLQCGYVDRRSSDSALFLRFDHAVGVGEIDVLLSIAVTVAMFFSSRVKSRRRDQRIQLPFRGAERSEWLVERPADRVGRRMRDSDATR